MREYFFITFSKYIMRHITAVGSNAALKPMIGNNTNVVDLKGKTVMSGLIDNHFHFMRGAWK